MVQFLRGNPRGKGGPSGPGVGNFSSAFVPGVGGEASRNTYSRKDVWRGTMARTAWNTLRANLSNLLDRSNVSKLKSLF